VWLRGSFLVPDIPALPSDHQQADASIPSGAGSAAPLLQLGQRIATARQAQGLSIETLANRLRLGTDQLEALEHADLSRLPEPVFVIAQARRVAASLGLDVDADLAALRSFATPRAARRVVPDLPSPGQPSRSPSSSFPLVPALVLGGLALAGAVVAAALLLPRPWARPAGTASAPSSATAPAPATATATVPAPATPSTTATAAAAGVPSAGTAAAAGATSAADELMLTTTGASWVEVRDAAGRSLFKGTLLQGEKRFPLGGGLRVMAGRPDLVSASVAGGPARVLGPISAVQWRGFSSSSPDPISVAPGATVAPTPAAVSPPGAPAP
jgi:cytoskeleton protein RodZ